MSPQHSTCHRKGKSLLHACSWLASCSHRPAAGRTCSSGKRRRALSSRPTLIQWRWAISQGLSAHLARQQRACMQVLYEDEYLLAVNKPPGISTAPRHRFEVSACWTQQL